jgi:hypothetical protein
MTHPRPHELNDDSAIKAIKPCSQPSVKVQNTALIRCFGGGEGTRTPDPLHAMQMRYQLRHTPLALSR